MDSGTYLGHIEVKVQCQPAEISTIFCLDKQTLNYSTPNKCIYNNLHTNGTQCDT